MDGSAMRAWRGVRRKFDKVRFFFDRRAAYRAAFGDEAGRRVLKDLAWFGYASRPTHVQGDPVQTAHNEGMRRMFLRIQSLMNMSEDEVYRLSQEEVKDHGQAFQHGQAAVDD